MFVIIRLLAELRLLSERNKIANTFNTYFVDITKKDKPTSNCILSETIKIDSNMYFRSSKVIKIVSSLNKTKTVEFDGISTYIIKQCMQIICLVLYYILNLLLIQGIYRKNGNF